MSRDEIVKGVRVVFRGPKEGITPLFDPSSHKLVGKIGTVVYGISEDIWCYPDDPASDLESVEIRVVGREKNRIRLQHLHHRDSLVDVPRIVSVLAHELH